MSYKKTIDKYSLLFCYASLWGVMREPTNKEEFIKLGLRIPMRGYECRLCLVCLGELVTHPYEGLWEKMTVRHMTINEEVTHPYEGLWVSPPAQQPVRWEKLRIPMRGYEIYDLDCNPDIEHGYASLWGVMSKWNTCLLPHRHHSYASLWGVMRLYSSVS